MEQTKVSAELCAKKSYLLFERKVAVKQLHKLKPVVEKLKYDFKKERYQCVADIIKEMSELQGRVGFNMNLKAKQDSFVFSFGAGSEYLDAIIRYSDHYSSQDMIKTSLKKLENPITLMLLASNNSNDEVVAHW